MKVEDPAQGNKPPISPRSKGGEPVRPGAAWHRISAEAGYLRAELFRRQTVEETKAFLEAVLAAALKHRLPEVLISVRNSKSIFTVERYGFSRYLDLAFKSKYKIALVGDAVELRIAHQYIATMARIRGVNLRAYADERAAIDWLRSGNA